MLAQINGDIPKSIVRGVVGAMVVGAIVVGDVVVGAIVVGDVVVGATVVGDDVVGAIVVGATVILTVGDHSVDRVTPHPLCK